MSTISAIVVDEQRQLNRALPSDKFAFGLRTVQRPAVPPFAVSPLEPLGALRWLPFVALAPLAPLALPASVAFSAASLAVTMASCLSTYSTYARGKTFPVVPPFLVPVFADVPFWFLVAEFERLPPRPVPFACGARPDLSDVPPGPFVLPDELMLFLSRGVSR